MGSFDMDRVELDWGGLDWDMRVCVGVGMVGFTRHFQSLDALYGWSVTV